MNVNLPVWEYYRKGYADPDFEPYQKIITKDRWGNEVAINPTKVQGCAGLVEPEIVRINKGLIFQRKFDTDPCPNGWKKPTGKNQQDAISQSFCVREEIRHEPIFYTDKAFIAKNQYFASVVGKEIDDPSKQSYSNEFDLRSIDHNTGKYHIWYQSKPSSERYQKYVSPLKSKDENGRLKQWDDSWYKYPNHGYKTQHFNDSYIA